MYLEHYNYFGKHSAKMAKLMLLVLFVGLCCLTFAHVDLEPRPEVAIDPERAALDDVNIEEEREVPDRKNEDDVNIEEEREVPDRKNEDDDDSELEDALDSLGNMEAESMDEEEERDASHPYRYPGKCRRRRRWGKCHHRRRRRRRYRR